MSRWNAVMVLASGLFAGGVLTIAWSRGPAWSTMPIEAFKEDFERTIRVADRLQPALLIVALVAGIGLAATEEGAARMAAGLAVAGSLATLVLSAAILVPLQRRIIASSDSAVTIDPMRRRWVRGHLGRTVLSVASFVAAAVASTG